MEGVEAEIVIVGAGIAGLTTSLGLHRLGIRSLVLESSESLRVSGFAFTTWTNAWRALDEIGIGDALRQQHDRLYGIVASSITSGLPTSEMSFTTKASHGDHEVRCVRRKFLLEALQNELPSGTIRFSSKVVSIEEDSGGCFKMVHLANGSVVKAKVLVGCDGVNSVVSKWLGFKKPAFVGRSAIRGFADFKRSHGFEPKFLLFVGKGVRCGFVPCNEGTVYWFFTFASSTKDKEIEKNSAKMKEFVLSNLGKVPDKVKAIVEITELDSITYSPLRSGRPWELLWANISKGNVCVTGDAFHPMTPDIRQGGCSALEDGVVLARCLAEALMKNSSTAEAKEGDGKEEYERIEMGMKKFAKERKWRGIVLVCTAYMVGFVQQSNAVVVSFLRDKVLGSFMAGLLLKRADFDCGKLSIS
ncbi:monooxygenase 2-like isoform X2 [Rhododendron vialii]|uniref:monooxygenase 2-like isoform X2 n=1 Tax=Rhododendron vialii TaxID=182163 RepID=UPI00265FD0E8|nr:monooxygenase 2-like isoform X2 [Rhododendron vialii]